MADYDLRFQYGVMRFRGIREHQSAHSIIFQSDDVLEIMKALERLAYQHEEQYSYCFC